MKTAPEDLAHALSAALEQHRLLTAEKELLEKTLGRGIKMLMEILAAVAPDLFGRAQALRRNVRTLSKPLRASGLLAPGDAWLLELAALLAQVGVVTVPPFVADKVRRGEEMNEAERRMWGRVPEIGYGLLHNIPRLEAVAEIVQYQHKHFDGGGLPEGPICGELIPIGARMLKVLLDLAEIEAGHISRAGAFALTQRQSRWYDPAVLAAAPMPRRTRADRVPKAVHHDSAQPPSERPYTGCRHQDAGGQGAADGGPSRHGHPAGTPSKLRLPSRC